MSTVSIIVPVYNPQEAHLIKCIESVINQTFENLEIIIIDNASTGNNPQILKEYSRKDERIKLIKFEKNLGYAGACNRGLALSTGDYVQFVDSDDWLEINAVEELLDFMENNKECDFCFFCANVFDDMQGIIADDYTYHFSDLKKRFNNNYFSYKNCYDIIFSLPSQAWNKFYRRKFLQDTHNCFDTELGTVLVDAFFSFNNYINAQKMILCPKVLYNYRVNIKESVVSSLSSKTFHYTDKPILFAKKLELIQNNHNIKGLDSKYFVESSIGELHWFYTLYNKKNRKLFHQDLRIYFKNNDKNIYTKENINASGHSYWYNMVRLFPYEIYNFMNFLYSKEDRENYYRIKICSITLFKRVESDNCIKYKILGIFHFKHNKNT